MEEEEEEEGEEGERRWEGREKEEEEEGKTIIPSAAEHERNSEGENCAPLPRLPLEIAKKASVSGKRRRRRRLID